VSDPNTYVFSKPITAIDRTLNEVTLREPTGEDLINAGDPAQSVLYSQRLAEILASLPTGTLRRLPARDVLGMGAIVSRFLAVDAPTISSTDTGSQPGSGATPGSSSV
jgi:hypothetical protein